MENNLYKPNNSIYQDSDPRGAKLVPYLLSRNANRCSIREEACRMELEFLLKKDSDLIKMPI